MAGVAAITLFVSGSVASGAEDPRASAEIPAALGSPNPKATPEARVGSGTSQLRNSPSGKTGPGKTRLGKTRLGKTRLGTEQTVNPCSSVQGGAKHFDGYFLEMKRISKRAQAQLKRARADADMIKIDCVNDKVNAIQSHISYARHRKKEFKRAAANNDTSACRHVLTVAAIIHQKVTVLGQEADTCAGEETSYVGETKVSVVVDPDIERQGDPTTETGSPPPAIRLPLASPTQ